MKSLLHTLFLAHWQRKATSLLLAVFIWFFVNQSLTTSKTFSNIPVKIVNIPEGKTVQGLQNGGLLKKRITLTLVGNKTLIDDLSSNDFEVILDAQNKPDEWTPFITPKNIISLNPEIEISNSLSKVHQQGLTIRLTKLVTEKIPILITKPIGDAPRDYQFLDIWPYQLTLTVTGPEDVIKRIKMKEVRLTFNLSDISKAQLDSLQTHVIRKEDKEDKEEKEDDVVSFYIPDAWKEVTLPLLSDTPLKINDPLAKELRIAFLRYHIFPIENALPVTLFFPLKHLQLLNPETYSFHSGEFFQKIDGVYFTQHPLFAKNVSHLFLQLVKDMMQITIIAAPKSERQFLEWSMNFINPRQLENRYVSKLISDNSLEGNKMQFHLREEYLRNRFRNFMNRCQLFTSESNKLKIEAEIIDHSIYVKSN
jgi:hypothetical protein